VTVACLSEVLRRAGDGEMEHFSQDDIQSFELIYNKYYASVYRFFIKRLSSKEVCEDLTSEVFYSCLKNFDNYDPAKASIATWIFVVANNKLKNHYRDKKDLTPLEDTYNALFDNADMDEAMFLTQMKIHLDTALDSATERERSIIRLRYFTELSSEEIATKIGISAGNVRVILTRTIKKLAKYFEDNGIRWE